ncbi:ribonuclease P protein component [Cryptosporangium aurantiacum]|uniref:Ribonuclease P protein component n=1 Tax=Cryptosporangium aurantiacum TaxID=134849 RepID=A0A1M7RKZ0_9ACTN|nr:ribonuclease P protein component [Cryptosporangium aurantiacum]SHN46829.1 ribonuclease P protein component [Cryptosporangium aurantiacum]
MLPAHARLRRREDFTRVLRSGNRAGRSTLVVHVALGPSASADPTRTGSPANDTGPTEESVRAGFVVSKAVGNAVVRHRVARQLRHLVRDRLPQLPAGSAVVVRALPAAAGQSSETLARDLDGAFRRILKARR